MNKKAVLVILLTGALLLGCSPASQAVKWAERAEIKGWQARYRIVFHQADGDMEMLIQEEQRDILVLDITMPSGSMRLEYGPDNLLINLDQGNLDWEDQLQEPPYYALSQLAKRIATGIILAVDRDWVSFEGFRIRLENGGPKEASFLDEWTLYVEEFLWD